MEDTRITKKWMAEDGDGKMDERFVIEPEKAAALVQSLGLASVMELLPALVPVAQRLARAPISRFNVGAVGLGSSGRIYFGVNLEFPGLPLHHSVHAEQFLVTSAAAAGEAAIRCIAVSAAPCGHCRQFLQEMRSSHEIQILVTDAGGVAAGFQPLSYFLPHPFGPRDLLDDTAPRLLEPHHNPIELIDDLIKDGIACNGVAEEGVEKRLKKAAERAAREAHAPYTGCAAGFAVADGEGRVRAGGYAESAAHNPGMGPVAAALVAWVAAGGEEWHNITAAALVEREDAAVSQEGTARILLSAVAPKAHLRVYRYRSPSGGNDE